MNRHLVVCANRQFAFSNAVRYVQKTFYLASQLYSKNEFFSMKLSYLSNLLFCPLVTQILCFTRFKHHCSPTKFY
ncbi:hypothetical protein B9Z55_027511 [Caenorhabditis nigoni]|uniref:Uncharacterized protein n=1 Tax=Caenorhabditis nigoni TaxID=1611254 RepID=A0A2G5SGA0_9PELO|nr:hypothetical protein B9Z55_027511 [Caenorhabditis nigoni]